MYEAAKNSDVGEVYIATPDKKIEEIVKKFGGKAILTSNSHNTGTDRIYEVFKETLNNYPNIIVNLQGDMPNINPESIKELVNYMSKNKCDIGTLASKFTSDDDLNNQNVVKVLVEKKIKKGNFVKALDFVRVNLSKNYQPYHHVGIYAYTKKALSKYVFLKRSKLELERKLEQLRALENDMSIHVGYINSSPLSVDTEEDLVKIKKLME